MLHIAYDTRGDLASPPPPSRIFTISRNCAVSDVYSRTSGYPGSRNTGGAGTPASISSGGGNSININGFAMSPLNSTNTATNSPNTSHGEPESEVEDDSNLSSTKVFHLEVVQHPERTAEIGAAAELSRLPLSPPLVVKVTVTDSAGNQVSADQEMPFLAAHLALYDEAGVNPVDLVEPPSNGTNVTRQRMLYGTLVSSIHHFRDLQNERGMYLIFPDVSVRRRGRYRLVVNLMRVAYLSPEGIKAVMPEGMQNNMIASVQTNPFDVVAQSEYSAPPPTALTSSFHRQGARMC